MPSAETIIPELCHLASGQGASYLLVLKIKVIENLKSHSPDIYLTTQWHFYSVSGKMLGNGNIKTKWPKNKNAVKLAAITALNVFVTRKAKDYIHWD